MSFVPVHYFLSLLQLTMVVSGMGRATAVSREKQACIQSRYEAHSSHRIPGCPEGALFPTLQVIRDSSEDRAYSKTSLPVPAGGSVPLWGVGAGWVRTGGRGIGLGVQTTDTRMVLVRERWRRMEGAPGQLRGRGVHEDFPKRRWPVVLKRKRWRLRGSVCICELS